MEDHFQRIHRKLWALFWRKIVKPCILQMETNMNEAQ